jgi:hypothetical protein
MAKLTLRQLIIAIAVGALFAALQGESPLRDSIAGGPICSEQPTGC